MTIQNIEAGGKQRPFLFSYKAIKELSSMPLQSMSEMEQMEVMAFLGFKYGAVKEGLKVDFKQADIENWLEDDLSLLGELQIMIDDMQAAQKKMMNPNREQRRKSQKASKK